MLFKKLFLLVKTHARVLVLSNSSSSFTLSELWLKSAQSQHEIVEID